MTNFFRIKRDRKYYLPRNIYWGGIFIITKINDNASLKQKRQFLQLNTDHVPYLYVYALSNYIIMYLTFARSGFVQSYHEQSFYSPQCIMLIEDYKLKSLVGIELLDENSPGKGMTAFFQSSQSKQTLLRCFLSCNQSKVKYFQLTIYRNSGEQWRLSASQYFYSYTGVNCLVKVQKNFLKILDQRQKAICFLRYFSIQTH